MNIKSIKELFLRFWHSKNSKISLIRDILFALLAVFIIIIILWSYTGQWLGTPMVAIESGSMMHANEPFGRLGTIDAGDMVLLVKVTKRSDIVTYGYAKNQGREDLKTYGNYGDVIVYRKYGDTTEDQIIHRAMCWVDVEINGTEKTYTIEEYGIYNQKTLYIPEIGLQENNKAVSPDWSHSGFITKGDNPYTNKECDQLGGICSEPIRLEWISGKARSELPWIGTINLFFNDLVSGAFWDNNKEVTVANVQSDSIACLIILLAVLISIPIILDFYDYYKTKKKQQT
ncbi:MAG: S26 family signal peptidase [Candidatus Thermoplasmatota archaeon]|jgi:signal peptidase|nr:S26 family signal peptidase [Candidatus Thermoplasmatota archaeon]